MPSPSDNRYQSRLFNFINKQSRFFRDLFGLRVRQLKVTTSWSVEAMLYPVYKLWQTTVELSKKQLPSHQSKRRSRGANVKNNSSIQTAVSVDMPILQVKEVLEQFQIERNQLKETQILDLVSVNDLKAISARGIASRISGSSSRASGVNHLVLVTDENEILDILTPLQQQKLQDVIITEVANYWEAKRLSEFKKPQPFLLKISLLFTKLTSGGSNTKKLNMASTDILPADIRQTVNQYRLPFSPNKRLFTADTAIARVESNTLLPVSQATLGFQKHSSQLVLFMKTKLGMFFKGQERVPNNTQNPVSTDTAEKQSFYFQNLIQGALNYFFGKGDRDKINQLETVNSDASSLPESISHKLGDEISRTPQINNKNLDRQNLSKDQETARGCAQQGKPWLELHDIFSESDTVQDPDSVTSFLMPQTEAPEPKSFFQRITTIFQGEEYSAPKRQYWIAKPKSADTEEDFTSTNFTPDNLEAEPTPIKNTSSAFKNVARQMRGKTDSHTLSEKSLDSSLEATSNTLTTLDGDISSGQIVHVPSESSPSWDIEDDPNYFDTEGKVLGYEKHPLEKILQCLDSALLKLEDIFARIVSLVQMFLRGL